MTDKANLEAVTETATKTYEQSGTIREEAHALYEKAELAKEAVEQMLASIQSAKAEEAEEATAGEDDPNPAPETAE